MKKLLALILILCTFSCDDGNFEIASFEFEEKVNYCGEYVLYRLSTKEHKEAFIVTLTEQQIKQSDEPVFPVSISATGLFTVTYRLFDEAVTSNYFCQPVPPIVPKIITSTGITALNHLALTLSSISSLFSSLENANFSLSFIGSACLAVRSALYIGP